MYDVVQPPVGEHKSGNVACAGEQRSSDPSPSRQCGRHEASAAAAERSASASVRTAAGAVQYYEARPTV